MVAEETTFCGGAYPDNNFYAVVFDMRTGEPVKGNVLVSTVQDDLGALHPKIGGVAFPEFSMSALESLAADRAEGECKQILAGEGFLFWIWPDARNS